MTQLKHRDTVYRGRILNLHVDQIVLEESGYQCTREWIEHQPAVAVLAQDNQGRLLLVRQYRYPVDSDVLELPAGLVDEYESFEEAALRELREETGYGAERLTLVGVLASSPGFTDEKLYLYKAEGLFPAPLQPDEGEDVQVCWLTPKELRDHCREGVFDGKTFAALGLLALE